MKKGILRLALIFCSLLIIQCGDKDETTDGQSGITQLPKISEILFGNEWSESDSTLADTSTEFITGTDSVVYYQVKFDTMTLNWFMVQKKWEKDSDELFTSVVLIPDRKKRICGELRRHDFGTISTGTYKLSVYYFDQDNSCYVEATYKTGVTDSFCVITD